MKKALLTGSHGFVGRHMTRELYAGGYIVTRVDKASKEYPYDALDFFSKHDDDYYDLAIHAAGHVGGRQDIDGAAAFIGANNAQLDAAFFKWVMQAKPRHAVYLSSSAAYPIIHQQAVGSSDLIEELIDLNRPELPDQTYGAVKLFGERLAKEAQRWLDANSSRTTSIHVVRTFSGYGTDQGTEYPFGAFLHRALQRCDPFTIWGDPTSRRDWIHIDDVCNAIMAIVDEDVISPVNISTGIGTEFGELAHMFTNAVGYTPQIDVLFDRPMGVHTRVGDPGRLRLFYTPRVSLDEGIYRAVRGKA